MVLKLRGDPARQAESVRSALQRVVPSPSYLTVQPLRNVVQRQTRSWRMGATLFLALGALATIVAAIGLYGGIAYNVRQRLHELGVRIALGAQRHGILWLVLAQSFQLALIGSVLGALVAFLAGRWIQPLLFQTSATDPRVYAGVCAAMFIVALAASALPAMRASAADPNLALRSE
jgi:ABC-type antimicrobial peptide transport system permease subunit